LAKTPHWLLPSGDARLRAALRELEAVLQSMMEGVLAVDEEKRILRVNEAAARLLRLEGTAVEGRPMQEVLVDEELRRFVSRVLDGRTAQEGELVFHDAADGSERTMQAHGTMLHDEGGGIIGVLVVLNDVTRLRRLEEVRRKFVANVSHELKTPITSIKGFVETLLDGAYKDPDEALRFLGIVQHQADRLNEIIEDLLMLSRLEQEDGGERPALTERPVRPLLEAAVQTCGEHARARDVQLDVACPEDLTARMNPALLEQAVVNLVENAVKYSERGRPVRVSASRARDGGVEIRVIDLGAGIASEHLPRLFERFYRVDEGRGRKQGGTGLGLAIVKHIAQVHGGSIDVDSTPGIGSTFTIRLP
jgi:two-component system phosphate regulon sensor histidine kinase PhoR